MHSNQRESVMTNLKPNTIEHARKLMLEHTDAMGLDVLMSADGGSHAWGYSQPTSDWDVKFLYKHKDTSNYLALQDPMQFTSWKMEGEGYSYTFDGWDVKKFLLLLEKGNAQTWELIESPYFEAPSKGWELANFVADALAENKFEVFCHYYGLAKRTYKERIANTGEPSMKKWFYVVRPLLCVEFLAAMKTLPPLQFESLLNLTHMAGLAPLPVTAMMMQLLKEKRDGDLTSAAGYDMSNVDAWVNERLDFWTANLLSMKPVLNDKDKVLTNKETFDFVYRDILNDRLDYQSGSDKYS